MAFLAAQSHTNFRFSQDPQKPLLLIVAWHYAVVSSGTKLVPTPGMVAVMMRDFAFGGVYDDAFSGTILTHLAMSMQRVYGGFALAAILGIPLGLLIGTGCGSSPAAACRRWKQDNPAPTLSPWLRNRRRVTRQIAPSFSAPRITMETP